LGVLAEHLRAEQFGAIFLIAAPFVGDGGWPSDELQSPSDLGAPAPAIHPDTRAPARAGLLCALLQLLASLRERAA
jgi:hypothetical protein